MPPNKRPKRTPSTSTSTSPLNSQRKSKTMAPDSTAPAPAPVANGSMGKTMPHIPLEVLRQISAHLDLPSAAALARTCRALRDAGEVRVWEELDLTCGGDHNSDTWNWNQEDHVAALQTCQVRVRDRKAAIEAYPARADYIRGVRLEPEGGPDGVSAKGVLEILKMVHHTLRRLYVLPCIYTSHQTPSGDPITFDSHFIDGIEDIGQFPMVEELATLDFEGPSTTFALVRMCPNLKALDTSMGSAIPSDRPRHATFPPMPKLERFGISHLENIELFDYDDLRVDLIQLFDVAPKLQEMKVIGWNPDWRVPPMLKKRFRRLKSLVLLADDLGSIGRLGVTRQPPAIGEEETAKTLEDLVVRDSMVEEHEYLFDMMMLPKIPSLKRLVLLTTPRMPNSDYADLGIGEPLTSTAMLNKDSCRQLIKASSLTTIQLAAPEDSTYPIYDSPCADNSGYFAHPSTWERDGHRGYIIRSYGTASPLIHMRGLSRSVKDKKEGAFVGARRTWRHYARYENRHISLALLKTLYATAGLPMDWLEGGRNLQFGVDEASEAKAFAMLQKWRDAGGDEGESDWFPDDPEEDEDLSDTSDESDDDNDDDGSGSENWVPAGPNNPAPGFYPEDYFVDPGDEDGWETEDDGDPLGGWDY